MVLLPLPGVAVLVWASLGLSLIAPTQETESSEIQTYDPADTVQPVPLVKVQPVFPKPTGDLIQLTHIYLKVTVSETGNVVKVVPTSGYREEALAYIEAAITAMKQWTFRPGTRNGQPASFDLVCRVTIHPR